MASDLEFVEYVCDQMCDAGRVRFRKMFGEFAIYCDEKVVALVCDDRLFVKPTPGGRAFIGEPIESPPYPSARPYFLIEDGIDDREWLTQLIHVTAHELPAPKPRKARSKQRRAVGVEQALAAGGRLSCHRLRSDRARR
jgi:TfoX/Sxy family transcriptional regulator of competence genes